MKKIFCIVFLGLALLAPIVSGAQVPKSHFPCGGRDPDSNCSPVKPNKRNKITRKTKAINNQKLQRKMARSGIY